MVIIKYYTENYTKCSIINYNNKGCFQSDLDSMSSSTEADMADTEPTTPNISMA